MTSHKRRRDEQYECNESSTSLHPDASTGSLITFTDASLDMVDVAHDVDDDDVEMLHHEVDEILALDPNFNLANIANTAIPTIFDWRKLQTAQTAQQLKNESLKKQERGKYVRRDTLSSEQAADRRRRQNRESARRTRGKVRRYISVLEMHYEHVQEINALLVKQLEVMAKHCLHALSDEERLNLRMHEWPKVPDVSESADGQMFPPDVNATPVMKKRKKKSVSYDVSSMVDEGPESKELEPKLESEKIIPASPIVHQHGDRMQTINNVRCPATNNMSMSNVQTFNMHMPNLPMSNLPPMPNLPIRQNVSSDMFSVPAAAALHNCNNRHVANDQPLLNLNAAMTLEQILQSLNASDQAGAMVGPRPAAAMNHPHMSANSNHTNMITINSMNHINNLNNINTNLSQLGPVTPVHPLGHGLTMRNYNTGYTNNRLPSAGVNSNANQCEDTPFVLTPIKLNDQIVFAIAPKHNMQLSETFLG